MIEPIRSDAFECRPDADDACAAELGDAQLRGAVVFDVDGDYDVPVGERSDCRGDELEAGVGNGAAGQPDCAGADAAECARGGEIRDTVSGVYTGSVWGAGREFAGAATGDGGVRMVRDTDLDWGQAIHSLLVVMWPRV